MFEMLPVSRYLYITASVHVHYVLHLVRRGTSDIQNHRFNNPAHITVTPRVAVPWSEEWFCHGRHVDDLIAIYGFSTYATLFVLADFLVSVSCLIVAASAEAPTFCFITWLPLSRTSEQILSYDQYVNLYATIKIVEISLQDAQSMYNIKAL